MRPVVRGDVPTTPDGVSVVFQSHREARDELIGRIGDYCSYCENALHSDIDVEHVQPKNPNGGRPDLALSWDNFLLACKYCNRTKWDKSVVLNDYFWPDVDNTFRAFIYSNDAPPIPDDSLPLPLRQIAVSTINLTGLDRVPGLPGWKGRDRRHIKRKEAYGMAVLYLARYQRGETSILDIALLASSRGFFSVWMTVFQNHSEVRKALICEFKADHNCFNAATTQPVRRAGGQI